MYLVKYSFITYVGSCIHQHSQDTAPYRYHKILLLHFYNHTNTMLPFHPHLQLLVTTNLFPISEILSFQLYHLNRIISYIIFWDWLFSLSVNSLVVPLVLVYPQFLLIAEQCPHIVGDPQFDCSPAEEHWGCFQCLLAVNKALNFVIGFT